MLELGGGVRAPGPGEGSAVLALASRLEKEAESLEKTGVGEAAAQAMVRRAARAIALTGENAGEGGSAHVLAAWTITGRMQEIDAALREAARTGLAEGIAMDLAALAASVPGEAAALDRALRGALGPLSGRGTGGGWIAREEGGGEAWRADELEGWGRIPGVTSGGLGVLGEVARLMEEVESGEGGAAYRFGNEATRRRVRAAATAIDRLPAWVTEAAREECGASLDRAMRELGSASTRETGWTRLGWLAGVGRLCEFADGMSPTSAEARKVREALLTQMSAVSRGGGLDLRPLDALERAMALARDRARLGDERDILRQVRPAWREMNSDAARSEARLIAALPRILTEPAAMTDPGIVSLISTHRRLLEDLAGMRRASEVLGPRLAGGLPAAPGMPGTPRENEHAIAAERVLALGQAMLRNEDRERARESLRVLGDGLLVWHEFEAEREMRGAGVGSAWSRVLSGREGDLLAAVEGARRDWLLAWGKGEATGGRGARLEALGLLVGLARDAVVFEEIAGVAGGEGGRIQRWAGWELGGRARRALHEEMTEEIGRAVKAALDGDGSRGEGAIRAAHSTLAAQRLAARLERELSVRERARTGGRAIGGRDDGRSGVVEVASGSPLAGEAWQERWRGDLASVCRYAEEWADARERGEAERARRVRAWVNVCAGRVGG